MPYDRGDLVARVHREGEVLVEEARGRRHPAHRAGRRRLAAALGGFAVPVGLNAVSGLGAGTVSRRDERPRDRGAAVRVAALRPASGTGRPPWWLVAVGRRRHGAHGHRRPARRQAGCERLDRRASDVLGGLGPARLGRPTRCIWLATQFGRRVAMLVVVLLAVAGRLARPAAPHRADRSCRSVLALAAAHRRGLRVQARRGPHRPGLSRVAPPSTHDGASLPSGHVANAVVMWGVARWQAVEPTGLSACRAAADG